MHTVRFKNPPCIRVELESGESLLSILEDCDGKLTGYQHSFNAVMDAIKGDDSFRGRHWWLIPGDVIKLPRLPDRPEDGVRARVRQAHHFRLHRRPQVIDVYLGFMDEEVNARLNALVQREAGEAASRQRPVILIERGKVDPEGPILEWSLGNYKIGDRQTPIRRIACVSPQGKMEKWEPDKGSRVEPIDMPTDLRFMGDWFRKLRLKRWADKQEESIAPEDIIARAMGVYMESDLGSDLTWLARGLQVKKYFDIIKLLQHRGRPGTKSKLPGDATGGGPWLSVVRFDVGEDNLLAPIVVVRSPEMGLQPSLMSPYLAFILKALSAASSQFAAIEAGQGKLPVRAAGGWDKPENADNGELWEDVEADSVYPTGKKLRKWPIWEWPLRVSQFGAQGSTSAQPGFTPGTIDDVVASLLVGSEVSSDVGMTATSGSTSQAFEYRHSVDGTEDAPEWEARDRRPEPDRHRPMEQSPPSFKIPDVKAGKTKPHVYAVISLCTPAGIYDFLRQEVEVGSDADIVAKINSATDLAQRVFRGQATTIRTDMARRRIDDNAPYAAKEKRLFRDDERPTLPDVISKIQNVYAGSVFQSGHREPVVTLTVTYFGGEKDKEAADKLGIRGVAMEDYHVLRVLRSAVAGGMLEDSAYPIVIDWQVNRINCDPKKLPRDVERDFNSFYRMDKQASRGGSKAMQGVLTIDDYAKAIIWGLRGLRREDVQSNVALREGLNWKYVGTIRRGDRPAYFWSFLGDVGHDDSFVPDPFCVEIATDFVNELADMDPGKRDSGIAGLDNSSSRKETAARLAGAVKKAWSKEGNQASTWSQVYSSGDTGSTKACIVALMEHLRDHCGFVVPGAGREYVKTWLRPGGKWADVGSHATLQDATAASAFKAAAIDRAFYKSSNMMALQTFADHNLW